MPFFKCTKDFSIVKVGYTDNPARAFRIIRTAMNALTDERECHFMSDCKFSTQEDVDVSVKKAKKEEHVLFIVPIVTTPEKTDRGKALERYKKYVKEVEQNVRSVIGLPLGNAFLDEFLAKLNEKDRKKLKNDCGMTKWVITKTVSIKEIQGAYREGRLGPIPFPPKPEPLFPPPSPSPRRSPSPPPPPEGALEQMKSLATPLDPSRVSSMISFKLKDEKDVTHIRYGEVVSSD